MKPGLLEMAAILVLLGGSSMAQNSTSPPSSGNSAQSQPSSAQPATTPSNTANSAARQRIAPGSVIPVQLTKSIDAKKVKVGDEVDAKVTQDMKAGNGEIIVPKDTKVVGHVTEAQVHSKEQKESQLGIAFDRAVMKNGGDVAVPMSIQAIISPSALSGGGNSNASDDAGRAPGANSPSGMSSGSTPGRAAPAQPSVPATSGGEEANEAQGNPHQPITGNTQGVVGISNLKLSTPADATQGSVVSSEKNNVKLESGILMLLRVNP